ncbi:hypothetical protein AB3S75_002985 [Citrus x aurantiifolia]
MDNVFKLHGLPKTIISDRDPIFTSNFWQRLFNIYDTKLLMSSAYHPQTDGQTEVVNRCLEQYLRCMTGDKPNEWVRWLLMAEYWFNTNFHTATKLTLFEAVYGRAPPSYIMYKLRDSNVNLLDRSLQDRDKMIQLLRENLIQSQHRMKQIVDAMRTDQEFKVGNVVFLHLQLFRQASIALRGNRKLAPKYHRPFPIQAHVRQVAYKLQLPAGSTIHSIFHVSYLKKKLGSWSSSIPHISLVDADRRFRIEPVAVLDRCMVKKNNKAITQVLVQWSNACPEDAMWETMYDLRQKYLEFSP